MKMLCLKINGVIAAEVPVPEDWTYAINMPLINLLTIVHDPGHELFTLKPSMMHDQVTAEVYNSE